VSAATTLEILVEEPSAERALRILVPKIVPGVSFAVRVMYGKDKLLKDLPNRLRGYAAWIASVDARVVVVIDRDDDDCLELKQRLDKIATEAGLTTTGNSSTYIQVLNRIVIEELEAWFFGDIPALRRAYPRISVSLGEQAKYRDPDRITGGTWEALERVLIQRGYHTTGLRKLEAAGSIAQHMDIESNRSKSFQVFCEGLRRLVSGGSDAQAN
jgi:hypothetical protein